VQQHFVSLYDGGDPASLQLRRDYAFPVYGELSEAEARQLAAFYFWTAWGATTNRPGQTITYTSNWPHEPLVGNSPTTGTLLEPCVCHPAACRSRGADRLLCQAV
jgi:nitric oxide reductase subunit B